MESVSGYIIPSFVLGCVVCGGIIKVVAKLWWKPMRIQRMMRAQGIEGPSYNFIQGNMAEMYAKRMHAMATPMDLSHNILPRVLPYVYSWLNRYGTKLILCRF